MICRRCGNQIEEHENYCPNCGEPAIQSANQQINYAYAQVPRPEVKKNPGIGIVALVMGILGLLAWCIPIVGFPVGIIALVFGIVAINKSNKAMSIAGIVMGVICLIATVINGAIGAYMGYNGQLWFQKGNDTADVYEIEDIGTHVFTIKDENGNVLITNGIKSAEASYIDAMGEDTGAEVVVNIVFDKYTADEFARVTEEHVGESLGIYLDGEIILNPRVNAAITDGECVVNGFDSFEEAKRVAKMLSACD